MRKRGLCLFLLTVFLFLGSSACLQAKDLQSLTELEKYSGYVYFTRPTCSKCVDFSQVLQTTSAAKERNLRYLDTDFWRKDPNFTTIMQKYDIKGVPSLLLLERGKIVSRFLTENTEEEKVKNDLHFFLEANRRILGNMQFIAKVYFLLTALSIFNLLQLLFGLPRPLFWRNWKQQLFRLLGLIAALILPFLTMILWHYEWSWTETFNLFQPVRWPMLTALIVVNIVAIVTAVSVRVEKSERE